MNRFEITASAPDKKAFSLLHYTKSEGIPKKQTIALWACDDCKTTVVGNNAVLFGCPCCSSNMKAGKTAEMTAAELDKAHTIADCGFCGSTLVSALSATATFKDKSLFCPVCSETVAVADDAADPDMKSDKDAAKTDDTDDLGDDTASDSDLPEGEDESGDDDGSGDGSDDDSGDDDGSDAEGDDEEEANDEESDDAETDETDSGDGDDNGSGDSDDENASSEDDKTDKDGDGKDDDSADGKAVKVGTGDSTLSANVLAAMAQKDTDVNIVQSPDRSRWYLFADNTPVAIAEAGRCDEKLRTIFATNQFATAYLAATSEGVTQDVLEEFGFEPVVTEVPVDEAVRQSVEAQVKEKTENSTMLAANYSDRFQQCFGMAAAGLPVNFFKSDRNPVEAALTKTLEKVGVRGAQAIVAAAFEKEGKKLYKTLVLRANDLMDKDDKTLEEIAKLIDERQDKTEESAPKPIAAFASMEDEPVKAPVVALTAADSEEDVFSSYFQRNR